MNIGIDITSLLYDRGVSRYTSNLVRALGLIKDVNLHLFGYSFRQKKLLEKKAKRLLTACSDSSSILIQNYPQSMQQIFWSFGKNRVKKRLPKIDVFHSWDWLQPPDKNLPLVSTIHDLAILKYPETAHPKILKMHQKSWNQLKQNKAEIIAVSQATKEDIISLLKIPASKVHVVHEALPIEIRSTSESMSEEKYAQIKNKLKLNKSFFFFVGTREPRKNLTKLIKAWQGFEKDYQLIIAGAASWDNSEKHSQENLRFLGKVSDEELTVLYGEAEMFIYPSLYEGFGLPILEAFYHGTPVISSDIKAIKEVAGNAAELINPNSIDDIKVSIKKILSETKLEQQQRLQKMIIRLQMFNWQIVAKKTQAVYQYALESK
jgi:glycosyltransferase involved in cell wall biosynthesis